MTVVVCPGSPACCCAALLYFGNNDNPYQAFITRHFYPQNDCDNEKERAAPPFHWISDEPGHLVVTLEIPEQEQDDKRFFIYDPGLRICL